MTPWHEWDPRSDEDIPKSNAEALRDRMENSPPPGADQYGVVRVYKSKADIPPHVVEVFGAFDDDLGDDRHIDNFAEI